MAKVNVETLLSALGLARKTEALGSVAVALVVGLVVGGVLGLVFAPQAGEKTREDLRRQAGEAKEDLLAVAKKLGQVNASARGAGEAGHSPD